MPLRLVEFQAIRFPFQADVFDQSSSVSFRVFDDRLVREVQPFDAREALPVLDDAEVIGESPADVDPVIGPADRTEAGLPAGQGDVPEIATAVERAGEG